MFEIYRNRDNHIVLTIHINDLSCYKVEVIEDLCVIECNGETIQNYFDQEEIKIGGDISNCVYLKWEDKGLHVYDHHHIDLLIQ